MKYIQLVIKVTVKDGHDPEEVLPEVYYEVYGDGVEEYELVGISVEDDDQQ